MLMASSNYSILFSSFPHSIPISSKFPILSPMIHSRRQHPVVLKEKCVSLGFSGLMEKKGLGGSIHLLQRSYLFESIRRRCNKGRGSEREGDFALEAEILEFMNCSENPNKFPTKKDLINAGRSDLVEAIEENRHWLSKGWDLDKEEEEIVQENEIVDLNSGVEEHSDDRIFQERCFNGVDVCIVASEDSSSSAPSSSGREMGKEESVDEDDGILKLLGWFLLQSMMIQSMMVTVLNAAEIGTDVATDKNASETGEERSQNDTQELQSRVQHLELELASILRLLKPAPEIDNQKEDSTIIFNDEDERNFYLSVKSFKDSTRIKVGGFLKKFDNFKKNFTKICKYFELLVSGLFGENQTSCFQKTKRILLSKENVNAVAKFCRDLAFKVCLKHIIKK